MVTRSSAAHTLAGLVLALAAMLAVMPPAGNTARAEPLAADISDHLIAITTAFAGRSVVLFGTSDGQGDIVVAVRGPREEQVVWRKERIAGIWVNTDQIAFSNVPAYYAVASTRPLEQIASPDVMARLELGLGHLRIEPFATNGRHISEVQAFSDALIRNKQRQQLYTRETGVVRFIGPRLFRAAVEFPANVPPGIYQVQIFELEKGRVIDAQQSTLVISRIGFEADLVDFAATQPLLYSFAAALIVMISGYLSGLMFRTE